MKKKRNVVDKNSDYKVKIFLSSKLHVSTQIGFVHCLKINRLDKSNLCLQDHRYRTFYTNLQLDDNFQFLNIQCSKFTCTL